MRINVLKYRKISFVFAGIMILGSLVAIFLFGIKQGIDFTGGSILEVSYKSERPSNEEIRGALTEFNLSELQIQPTSDKGVILRMGDIPEETHQAISAKLMENREGEEMRFESIGPVIGKELKEKTKAVVILSLLAIVVYISTAFKKLEYPARSWEYAIVSLLALCHNILIPLGIFSVLGKYYNIQISIPIVVALLTVVGYTINDTVVVFDRVRENILKRRNVDFEQTVNDSINQTIGRSISASFTTLLVLISIYFFGGETLKDFSLALILGISFGAFSSIFLVMPFLVSWLKFRKRI